jgi:hypothetical protein
VVIGVGGNTLWGAEIVIPPNSMAELRSIKKKMQIQRGNKHKTGNLFNLSAVLCLMTASHQQNR